MGLAFLITSDRLQLLGERKVLKEAEYAALLDAEGVIAAANAEALRIADDARKEAARARDTAFAEGLERARMQFAERMVTDAVALQNQLQGLRDSMAQIIVKAVGQFMAEADPSLLFQAALLRVESLVRTQPFITVRVAPDHEHAMRSALDELHRNAGWSLPATIVADPELPHGACLLVSASGTLEIGVDAQLAAFRKAIEVGASRVRGAAR